MKKVKAVFDIGKTNKKFFLFDKSMKVVFTKAINIVEVKDEDGYPCDDLEAIVDWVISTFNKAYESDEFHIAAVNFSTYGASFVHIDGEGKVLTPLYNYLKPIGEEIEANFYKTYGDKTTIAKETASPPLAMLNSGLQLYWLKHKRPEVFEKVVYSMHFPQYLSYLFTGTALSEYTSIGCHTALWDFDQQDYHEWVYTEGIDQKLPPIVATSTVLNTPFLGNKLQVGVGIHDSSAALLPYLKTEKKTFALLSTGTWCIALNPFNTVPLKFEQLKQDCLNFMKPDGGEVRASRLFMGYEYQQQLNGLKEKFSEKKDDYSFDIELYNRLNTANKPFFIFDSLPNHAPNGYNELSSLLDFKTAYHQLMLELVVLQVQALKLAIGENKPQKLYIDGGFVANEVFVKMLAKKMPELKIRTAKSAIGSAIGAAIIMSKKRKKRNFLKRIFSLKKY